MKTVIINILDDILGVGTSLKGDEQELTIVLFVITTRKSYK